MKHRIAVLLTALAMIIAVCAGNVLADSSSPVESSKEFELHMLDVGQGLSILIKADGKWLLYDGGDEGTSSYVVAYLKEQKIEKLDYVVASHFHPDHLNGVIGVLHAFSCDTIVEPNYTTDRSLFKSYQAAAKDSGAKIIHPKRGDEYKLGKAAISVVGPKDYEAEDENDRSIALRIEYGNTHYLLCADATENEELDILNSQDTLQSDVYVIDHHGSKNSSTELFLGNVKPRYALLSCGKANPYGHPAERVLKSLEKLNCKVFWTGVQGEIVLKSDGKTIETLAEPMKASDILKTIKAETGGGADTQTTETRQPEEAVITPEATSEPAAAETKYICNTNSHKFHHPWCDSVNKMSEKNKKETSESRESLIAQGYDPCQNCKP